MIKQKLLINCDMGEWDAPHLSNQDENYMPFIDLCNIACGGHAGSEEIIESTILHALQHDLKIGAHPGYEDRENFGRKYIPMKQSDLSNSLVNQLSLFHAVCVKLNASPNHIKVHGALYHACNHKEMEAEVLIDIVKTHYPDLYLFVAQDSLLQQKAQAEGIKTISESFIDRKYNNDLTLISRSETDAVIENVMEAKNQYESLSQGKIITNTGKTFTLQSETACIHGDNPNCLQILRTIRNA